MPRITLDEVVSLGDPLLSDMFRLNFFRIPGSGTDATRLNQLSISCQQVTLPSRTVDPVEVALGGYSVMYGGRQTYSHDLQITFVETREMTIINTLSSWMDFIRDKQSQKGNLKKDYSTKATIEVYRLTGEIQDTYTLFNVWCNSLPEVQFDSTSANLITVGASFQYDYWLKTGTTS